MSQRDQNFGIALGTNAQDVSAAIDSVLAEVDFPSVRFRDDCGWAVRGLVAVALVWGWSAKGTLGTRLNQALRLVRSLGQFGVPVKISYQAVLKMLVRWTGVLSDCLRLGLRLLMQRKFREEFCTAGFVVLACDGSKLQLARTQSNEACYSPKAHGKKSKKRRKASRSKKRPRSKKARAQQAVAKKSDSPQMALTLLYHVGIRLPWDWQLGPSNTSEREQLRAMIPNLPANALITADCGFVGYDFWSDLVGSGRQFVIRVGGNVRLLKNLGCVRESQGIVYLWPDNAAKKKKLPPLRLRLVVVHDGRKPWYLVTSVRNEQRLSDEQVAGIYRRRWRIELYFRHFKQTYGRAKLRSHKAEHAEVEAEWSLLALWIMLLHARLQLPKNDQGRLSVAKVLDAFAQAIDEYKSLPDPGESLTIKLSRALMDTYHRRHKTSRNYPRKKYETQAGAPKILTATASQREQARECERLAKQKGLTA